MIAIDPEGLFSGDRLAGLTWDARLLWPYFYLASNDCGRLELNYLKLAARIFPRFPRVPSEAEVMGWLREYQDAYLLYVYETSGQVWGQWDTTERCLPRYKSRASQVSPDPGEAFMEWKKRYVEQKTSQIQANPIVSAAFGKLPETLPRDFGRVADAVAVPLPSRAVAVAVPMPLLSRPVPCSDSQLEPVPDTRELAPEFYRLAVTFQDAFLEIAAADPVTTGRFEASREWVAKLRSGRIGTWNLPLIVERHQARRGQSGRLEELRWWIRSERWQDTPSSRVDETRAPTSDEVEESRKQAEEIRATLPSLIPPGIRRKAK